MRRYLPGDLSVSKIHADYNEQNPQNMCSFSTFYKIFKSMKISITEFGNEACETCEECKIHSKQCSCNFICDMDGKLIGYISHKAKAKRTRREYTKDKEDIRKIDTLKVTADLQKIILLPRMDQFKSGLFTPRLVVFNETMS